MVQLLLAAIAGAGFTVASLLGAARVTIGARVRAAAAGLAAGILLALALAELFPEALERAGHEWAVAGFVVGFLALFLVETATKAHTHHAHDQDRRQLARHALAPFVVGLGFHNATDGFAIAASTQLAEATGVAVAAGVLVHQLPVGISFAAVLLALATPRRIVVEAAVGLGVLIPAGALVVAALPALGGLALGALLGTASGALTYIAAGHLLPEAQSERVTALAATTFPVALVATTLLFLAVLQHD